MFKVNVNLGRSLYLAGFLHQVVPAEQPLCQVFDCRDGCPRVKFIRSLRQLQVVGSFDPNEPVSSRFPNHAIETSTVQKKRPHVDRPVPVVRG